MDCAEASCGAFFLLDLSLQQAHRFPAVTHVRRAWAQSYL